MADNYSWRDGRNEVSTVTEPAAAPPDLYAFDSRNHAKFQEAKLLIERLKTGGTTIGISPDGTRLEITGHKNSQFSINEMIEPVAGYVKQIVLGLYPPKAAGEVATWLI